MMDEVLYQVMAAVKVPDLFTMIEQAHPRKRADALDTLRRAGFELAPQAEART